MQELGRMQELWRGGVEAWECDEMGHMNVRFWLKRALQTLGPLAHGLGRPDLFSPNSPTTLVPVRQNVRFLKEAHAGAPLFMRGGLIDSSETTITLYVEAIHSGSGAIAATFVTELAHVSGRQATPFPLTKRIRAKLDALMVTLPDHGQPRSLPLDGIRPDAGLDRAEALGFSRIGLSMVRADEVDCFGRFCPEMFISRISEGVPNLMGAWRETVAAGAGAAVLENRLHYLRWPGVGDLIDARSAVVEIGDKAHTLQHWLMDPRTGKPWCISEAVAVTFDLTARKAMIIPHDARAALVAMQVPLATIPTLAAQ